MQEAHDELLAADVGLRVSIPFRVHNPLIVVGQRDSQHGQLADLGDSRQSRPPPGGHSLDAAGPDIHFFSRDGGAVSFGSFAFHAAALTSYPTPGTALSRAV
jgi:hypothetical protein